ncbi:MAG: benzoyl-CoA-dihydrodiol lyase [Myxococcales bacterium]|nr:benzoyl-CoA-dihydrodiol lyase [Myxococcales bacterium]
MARVDFQTDPSRYRHWLLRCDGAVATLAMNVAEDGGIRPGYALKLNSYDLGVDIELADALNRIRFEHPEVRAVILTSARPRVFCAGANIHMLGQSTHAWKVNFCKFTNETRNGIEDSSRYSGLRFLAAVNGACAGGGYELALACDEIWLVDDRSSAVSLPEVPLLGVLPGTGGLTRLLDKRKVRPDRADVFCTTVEGLRGERAKEWRLVDEIVKVSEFEARVRARSFELAGRSDRPADAPGVTLPPLERTIEADAVRYPHVVVAIDRARRVATITVRAPVRAERSSLDEILARGAAWWPLAMGRELDDAILSLRTNELEIGTWLLRTEGDGAAVLAVDEAMLAHRDHWFVRETIGLLRRTLARLEVSSRTLFALIEPGSCFAGSLLELALAADRTYMRASTEGEARIAVGDANFGRYPPLTGRSRLGRRFHEDATSLEAVRSARGRPLGPTEALALGLVTSAPDDIDWAEELRVAVEERASLSPDALTGMEATLRWGGQETMAARIFGRLTAWQNWIFSRPNAVGPKGALKVYGKGEKPEFDFTRV